MSREVDKSGGVASLEKDDIIYLLQRDQLTNDELNELGLDSPQRVQAYLRHPDEVRPEDLPYSGNTMVLTEEEIAMIQQRRAEGAVKAGPTIDVQESVVPDEGEETDYDEGWTNDERRAELASRGLDTDGNKQELIDRLKADDEANAPQ